MTISLAKKQSVSLTKESNGGLTAITLGVGWDVAKKKGFFGAFTSGGDIDLDASAILFDGNRQTIDAVWFGQLKSKDGSVRHSGDNLTGKAMATTNPSPSISSVYRQTSRPSS